MAIELKATVKKVEAEVVAAPKKVNVRAAIGDIVHPFTHVRFTIDSLKPHDLDSWIEIQRDAGKIEVAE